MATVIASQVLDPMDTNRWQKSDQDFWVVTSLGSVLVSGEDRGCFLSAPPDTNKALLTKISKVTNEMSEDEDTDPDDSAKGMAKEIAKRLTTLGL